MTPGCPRGSLEVLGEGLGGTQNRRGFLGGSRESPGGLGVVLVLWDGPWVGPGKWKCWHFVDNTDVLAMRSVSLCFC